MLKAAFSFYMSSIYSFASAIYSFEEINCSSTCSAIKPVQSNEEEARCSTGHNMKPFPVSKVLTTRHRGLRRSSAASLHSAVTCCVSVQGLRPLKDSAFVVFEGESFRETSLTSSAVVKCDGLAFGAFPGCVIRSFTLTSRFLPPRPSKVTIYATRCRHFLSFFLPFWSRKESWDMWGHEVSKRRGIWRSLRTA